MPERTLGFARKLTGQRLLTSDFWGSVGLVAPRWGATRPTVAARVSDTRAGLVSDRVRCRHPPSAPAGTAGHFAWCGVDAGTTPGLNPHTVIREPTETKSRSRTKPNVKVLDREQRELLRLLASGLPDTAVARRMCLAPRTLARRIANLYEMLQADNRFQAGAAAERLGLLDTEIAVEATARLAG